MCSSGAMDVLNPVKTYKSLNEEHRKLTGGLQRKVLGGQTLSEATGFNTKGENAMYKTSTADTSRLAIGTQTGGTRKPLGSSSSGLNR